MKKSFLILLLLLGVAVACNSGDDTPTNSETTNTDTSGDTGNDDTGNDTGNDDPVIVDPDGDGIDSDVEVDQGTDPEDGCSFLVESIDFSITTTEWRELDCDEDGVTNGKELDPDGDLEIGTNATDPQDPCSLVVEFQEDPPQSWLELNCDEDCYLNGLELALGWDPLNANTANVNQGILSKIRESSPYNTFEAIYSSNPQRIQRLNNSSFGSISTRYEYDGLNNLISVSYVEADQGVIGEMNLTYNGNQLVSFLPFGPPETVEYDGNFIISSSSEAPTGLFTSRIELDPTTQKVVQFERYAKKSSNLYDHYTRIYHYDASMENLLEVEVMYEEYDADTGTANYPNSYSEYYEYYENILNPAAEAHQYHLIPSLLVDKADSYFLISYTYFGWDQAAVTSKNLLKRLILVNLEKEIITDSCAESNSYPLVAGYSPYESLKYFIYE